MHYEGVIEPGESPACSCAGSPELVACAARDLPGSGPLLVETTTGNWTASYQCSACGQRWKEGWRVTDRYELPYVHKIGVTYPRLSGVAPTSDAYQYDVVLAADDGTEMTCRATIVADGRVRLNPDPFMGLTPGGARETALHAVVLAFHESRWSGPLSAR